MDDKIISALWPSSGIDSIKPATTGQPKPIDGAESSFAEMVKNQQGTGVDVKANTMVSALRQVEQIAQTQGTETLVNLQLTSEGETVQVNADVRQAAAALYGKWSNQ